MANEKRLIDANEIKYHTVGAGGWSQPEKVAYDYEIDKIPTVESVEVVHGVWVWKDGKWFCSVCSEQGEAKRVYQDGTVDEYPYCPNCGAKMDGERNG